MEKFWIVFRREYTSRVLKKSFLLATFLMPLLFAFVMFIPALAAVFFESETYTVHVIDPTGKVLPRLQQVDEGDLTFVRSEKDLEELRTWLLDQKNHAALLLPADVSKRQLAGTFYATQSPSIKFESKLKRRVKAALREIRLVQVGIPLDKLSDAEVRFELTTQKISESGTEETSAALGFALAYTMAFLNYFMLFIYGSILMQGVLEEKANRIMEVMISSVRPLQMMFAKILSVGAVGLTQFLIWVVLIILFSIGIGLFLGPAMLAEGQQAPGAGGEVDAVQVAKMQDMMKQAAQVFKPIYLLYFVIYFLGGYVLYGSLFAAVGASVDEISDSQQFTTVISLPVIIPIILLPGIMNNPNSAFAFWFSIIPFFSPIIMMARVAATEVPLWEVLLSIALLILGIMGSVWVASRIYRVGVLMYGKKPTFRELYRWITLYQ